MKKKKSPRRLLGDSVTGRMNKNANIAGSRRRRPDKRDARNGNGSRPGSQSPHPLASELAREEAIQRYAELYDFAPTGYVSFDRSGRIEEINLTAARLLGFNRENLIGMPFAVLVYREDTTLFLEHLLRCRSDRKSTRLNSSHQIISYAVFCLKKKKKKNINT